MQRAAGLARPPVASGDILLFHGPARIAAKTAFGAGGPTDIAYANAKGDFEEISHIPVFEANTNTGHDGTYWEPYGGRFAETIRAWLKWQLKGDAVEGRTFAGADCGLCRSPVWTVRKKNLP